MIYSSLHHYKKYFWNILDYLSRKLNVRTVSMDTVNTVLLSSLLKSMKFYVTSIVHVVEMNSLENLSFQHACNVYVII